MTASDWRWSRHVAVGGLVVFLLVQLALPVLQLSQDHERAQRFGWQMFAYATTAQFTMVTADGEELVDLDEVMARPRADIDLESLVPPHICATRQEALYITWDGGRLDC